MLYSSCYLNDLVIAFGKTVNSISGALDTVMTGAVFAWNNYDLTDATSMISILYAAAIAVAPQDFGIAIGQVIREFFNIVVPSAQYQDY